MLFVVPLVVPLLITVSIGNCCFTTVLFCVRRRLPLTMPFGYIRPWGIKPHLNMKKNSAALRPKRCPFLLDHYTVLPHSAQQTGSQGRLEQDQFWFAGQTGRYSARQSAFPRHRGRHAKPIVDRWANNAMVC